MDYICKIYYTNIGNKDMIQTLRQAKDRRAQQNMRNQMKQGARNRAAKLKRTRSK